MERSPHQVVALIFWLLLWGASIAWSQSPFLTTTTRIVIFHTSPEGALVSLSTHGQPKILGYSGQSVPVTFPTDMNVTLHFIFSQPGYQNSSVDVTSESLQAASVHSVPEDGTEILLVPTHIGIYLVDQVAAHPALTALALASLAAAAWGTLGAWRRLLRKTGLPTPIYTVEVAAPLAEEFTLVGSCLGRWLLTDKIGQGGMAVVYRAVPQETLDDQEAVAIKVLKPHICDSPEAKARFEREVRIGAKLNHPNIVRLVDWSMTEPLFLVMEIIEGQPLRRRVLPDGLSPRLAMDLMTPVFEAMIYAHDEGVWHRDLKPENIFISRGNKITVMDFGISRQVTDATVTATDQMPVTPGYMSPEQFSGKNVAAASDQYTLGIMMWEMLVGHRPFEDESPIVVVLKHMGTPLPPMRAIRPELPEAIDWVLERMCAKDTTQRYPDLRSALQALEDAVSSYP